MKAVHLQVDGKIAYRGEKITLICLESVLEKLFGLREESDNII